MSIFVRTCDWTLNQTGHSNATAIVDGSVFINASFFWATLGYIAASRDRTQIHGIVTRRDTAIAAYGGGFGIKAATGDSYIDGLTHAWGIVSGGNYRVYESGSMISDSGSGNDNWSIQVDTSGVVTYWYAGSLFYTSSVPAPNPFYWVAGGGVYFMDPTASSADSAGFGPGTHMNYFESDGGGGGPSPLVRGQSIPSTLI